MEGHVEDVREVQDYTTGELDRYLDRSVCYCAKHFTRGCRLLYHSLSGWKVAETLLGWRVAESSSSSLLSLQVLENL